MKYKFYLLSSIILSVGTAFASEEAGHHEPSIWDLKYPALNFFVLAGFIIYKAKKPLSDMFTKNAENIKSLMESAEKQAQDANQKLQELQAKIKNLESEVVKINTDYEQDTLNFTKNQSNETATTIARMKRDVESKLAGEKNELNDNLGHELLSLVVSKTQTDIGTNKDLKNKATTNIIAGMK